MNTGARYNKEAQLYPKIRANFEECEKIQEDKCKIANTSLFLLTKHLVNLEADIGKLEKEGLFQLGDELFSMDNETYLDDASSLMSSDSTAAVLARASTHRRTGGRKSTSRTHSATPSISGRAIKRQKTENGLGLDRAGSNGVSNIVGIKDGRAGSASLSEYSDRSGSVGPNGRGLVDDELRHKVKTENDSINDIQLLNGAYDDKKLLSKKLNENGRGSVLDGDVDNLGSMGRTTGPNGTPASTPTKFNGVENSEDQTLYCFCRQVSFGEMIACDNSKCKYEWFHYKCVGLTAEPTGKWYCPDCTKKLEKKKRKKN